MNAEAMQSSYWAVITAPVLESRKLSDGATVTVGLSQMQLAALVRLGHVTISWYETGISPFNPDIFREALPELEQTINRLRGIP